MASDISDRWREQCAEQLRVVTDRQVEGAEQVLLPARTLDGHSIEIVLLRDDDGWQLTDMASTTSEFDLVEWNWRAAGRHAAIADIARSYDAKLEGRAIIARGRGLPDLTDVVLFIQALSAVAALEVYDGPPKPPFTQYRTDLGGFMRGLVEDRPQTLEENYRSPEDVDRAYVADFAVMHGDVATGLLFAASSTETAANAALIANWWDRHADQSEAAGVSTVPRIAFAGPGLSERSDAWTHLRDHCTRLLRWDPDVDEAERIVQELVELEVL